MTSNLPVELSNEYLASVDNFISVKRLALIHALFKNGSMTQSQLASAISSTVTSLSNIIRVFDESGLGLLSMERDGKYRRYSLSPRGTAFARRKFGAELSDSDPENNAGKLYVYAVEALHLFQEQIGQSHEPDQWKLKFDEALFERSRGGLWLDKESEEALNRFLNCLEIAVMTNDLDAHEQIMDLVSEPILRLRIELFMNVFQPFVPLLRAIRNGSDEFDVSLVIRAALIGQLDEESSKCRERIGIKPDEYDSIEKTASYLAGKIRGREKSDIYRYFSGLLPEQKWLCSLISQIL